jgi:hypothetical protein
MIRAESIRSVLGSAGRCAKSNGTPLKSLHARLEETVEMERYQVDRSSEVQVFKFYPKSPLQGR